MDCFLVGAGAILLSEGFYADKKDEEEMIMEVANYPPLIIVDAGHGGKDKGASSSSGVSEADINLVIAKYLKEELESKGMQVVLTREDAEDLASDDAPNKKREDLRNRHGIINDKQPELVVSIHLNNFIRDRSVSGVQVFYQKGSVTGENFANAIQAKVNSSGISSRSRTAKSGDFYILETIYPSVLIECGFLSNYDDESKLQTEEHQRCIARCVSEAIVECLEKGSLW